MRIIQLIFFLLVMLPGVAQRQSLLSAEDFQFLESLTRSVLDSSRIRPGEVISPDFGPNNTGGTLVRPGGRTSYPSFWIRDYAMSLETGFVTAAEQLHMLQLTAATQCDQSWITKGGSMVPAGSIADHIRIDDAIPIYFPGTYDAIEQGQQTFGMMPPYCDQFFFIHMAAMYVSATGNVGILNKDVKGMALIDRLVAAYQVVPTDGSKALVYTTNVFRGVDFGFRDVITMTGYLCMPSILKYKASLELAGLFRRLRQPIKATHYASLASSLKSQLASTFADADGMLRASTEQSRQRDVWSTALAISYNLLQADTLTRACTVLRDAFSRGQLAKNGNIRHVITSDDFSATTSWEKSLATKGTYQNGGYWGTPTGWVCEAIARVDLEAARKLAKEYIDDLRKNDFRKGPGFGAPWECYNEVGEQNPVYLTTVACPLVVFRRAEEGKDGGREPRKKD